MSFQRLPLQSLLRLPVFLAAALPVFLAVSAFGGEAKLQQPNENLIEITGGGGKPWTLRYSTKKSEPHQAYAHQFVLAGEHRAWFSHGPWLRLIDTDRGVVMGRWYVPGVILRLAPKGESVTLEVDSGGLPVTIRKTYEFDPRHPNLPSFPVGHLLTYRVAETEPLFALRATPGMPLQMRLPVDAPSGQSPNIIPQLQEQAQRDPFSPWVRLLLGAQQLAANDPHGKDTMRQAVEIPGLHHFELMSMAHWLSRVGQYELSREAFDRGYADFIRQGNDPRLFTVLISRLVVFTDGGWRPPNMPDMPAAERAALQERLYRLAPYSEGADVAWQALALDARARGDNEQAHLWQARADDAARRSFSFSSPLGMGFDQALLATWAAILASVLFVFVKWRRYSPQRHYDVAVAARERRGGGFNYFRAIYWDRGERIAFVAIVLVAWLAAGICGTYLTGVMKMAVSPLETWMGSFGGPVTSWHFEHRPIPGPATDLLKAMAYQASGELDSAERLYRATPQFAESWNNLGVILSKAGHRQEARQAFERALSIDPNCDEAAYNLGRGSRSMWTDAHQRYLPGEPMVAPPSRKESIAAHAGDLSYRVPRWFAGPWGGMKEHGGMMQQITDSDLANVPSILPIPLCTALLITALLLGWIVPAKEVTEAQRSTRIADTLFPGVSPRYGFAGVFLLVVWCYFVLQLVSLYAAGSPYLLTFGSMPNVIRSWGPISPETIRMIGLQPRSTGGFVGLAALFRTDSPNSLVQPSWLWTYVPMTLLFGVNALLVWRRPKAAIEKKAEKEEEASASAGVGQP